MDTLDGMQRRLKRSIVRRTSAALLAASAMLLAAAPPAHADDDLDVVNDVTYRVDGESGVVHVTEVFRLENTKPDQRESNGVRYFYFTGYRTLIPVAATNITALTADGTVLATTTSIGEGPDYVMLDVEFAKDLRYGKVLDVTVSYDLVGAAPRDERLTRTNPAVAAFGVFGFGEPGKVSVRLAVPTSYEVETVGTELTSTVENGERIYDAGVLSNPDEFYVYVTARRDAQLVPQEVAVGDAKFRIRSWPGDTEWQSFVTDKVTTGLPQLEAMIGQPWPHATPFELVESLSPYLYGYAGWYDAIHNQIEVGEDLDQEVMLHELSHAWFNRDTFKERWINEGLADAFAAQAMTKLGQTPSEQENVTPKTVGAVRLAEWDEPTGTEEEIERLEDFGYSASRLVVSKLVDEIGEEGARKVIAAATTGEYPYVGEGDVESIGEGPADWRRFLDLLEEVGGAKNAEPLLREWVTQQFQDDMLDERAAARTTYDKLEVAGGEWAVPVGAREAMTEWNFKLAETRMASASEVLKIRDETLATIEPLGLTMPTEVEDAYQAADELLDEPLARANEYAAAADVLVDSTTAHAAPRGLFTKIGLWDSHPEIDHAAALTKFQAGDTAGSTTSAKAGMATLAAAEDLGKERATIAGGGLAGFVGVTTLTGFALRRRKRRRKAAALDPVTALVAESTAAGHAEITDTPPSSVVGEGLEEYSFVGAHNGWAAPSPRGFTDEVAEQ